MAEPHVIDPITRIEGHLRIELETENAKITNAWSEATQFRGLEALVANRDPRDVWAFLQRICGVCTTTHAIASVTAVENAIGSRVPPQALLIRDLVMGSAGVQDHVIHFYHLHALDWVNVVSASKADPAAAVEFARAIGSTWKGNTLERMTAVSETIKTILASGQLSIFTGGYWDHPDYRLPPEANLMACAHYLDALEFQRSMIRINTVFGGKNPHPNFLVGGMACTIDPNRSESINHVQIAEIQKWLDEAYEFVTTCYIPDAKAIMGVYKDYFDIGVSSPNYLAVGMLGAAYGGDPNESPAINPMMEVTPGVIFDDDFDTVHTFEASKITESVASAWFKYSKPGSLPPAEGETVVDYTGPTPPYTWLADRTEYTWSKAPRYSDKPMQVGPLARVMLAYARKHPRTVEIVNAAAEQYGITLKQMNSTGGRTLARAVECLTSIEMLVDVTFPKFVEGLKAGDIDVFDSTKWEPKSWPKAADGYSLIEVARGTLGHWVKIKNRKVSHYQAIVPSTWNGGGRDEYGVRSPYEEALASNEHHPLVNPEQPLEVIRTIHSFDPCMSCAVHVLDPQGNELQVAIS
ncbi:MAG: nickel-dependent hydrogenase large subunit [Propionibacteriaceae bacterium]|jgi:hydrogenase large subunit|nr:nickel-dependent hydrogenase large subunit [Propionibacteriaceae bacterium]